jgi:Protein of unknown function (DUF4065)
MNSLNDVLLYLYQKHPNPLGLGISRAMKLLFLADWKSCVEVGSPVTEAVWINRGQLPFSSQVVKAITDNPNFEIEYKGPREESIENLDFIIVLKPLTSSYKIPENHQKTLLSVIKETALMNWRDLNEQVRATFPFLAFDTPERLNLVELAKQYLWVFNSPARRTIFIQTRTLDRAVLASESDLVQHSSASPTQSAALKSSSAAKHIGGKTHIYLRSTR